LEKLKDKMGIQNHTELEKLHKDGTQSKKDKCQILDPGRNNQLQKHQGTNNCLHSNSLPENSTNKAQQCRAVVETTILTDTSTGERPTGKLKEARLGSEPRSHRAGVGGATLKQGVIQLRNSDLASRSYGRAANRPC